MSLIEPSLGAGAVISPCGRFRFLLWRIWARSAKQPRMLFVGINPSTADGRLDDPTVRRCAGFAQREKCGGFEIVNLFAERSTDPRALSGDPEPPESDAYIRAAIERCEIIVAAWGAASFKVSRAAKPLGGARETFVVSTAIEAGREILCLGTTHDGWPRHPLFVNRAKLLEPWVKP